MHNKIIYQCVIVKIETQVKKLEYYMPKKMNKYEFKFISRLCRNIHKNIEKGKSQQQNFKRDALKQKSYNKTKQKKPDFSRVPLKKLKMNFYFCMNMKE